MNPFFVQTATVLMIFLSIFLRCFCGKKLFAFMICIECKFPVRGEDGGKRGRDWALKSEPDVRTHNIPRTTFSAGALDRMMPSA